MENVNLFTQTIAWLPGPFEKPYTTRGPTPVRHFIQSPTPPCDSQSTILIQHTILPYAITLKIAISSN